MLAQSSANLLRLVFPLYRIGFRFYSIVSFAVNWKREKLYAQDVGFTFSIVLKRQSIGVSVVESTLGLIKTLFFCFETFCSMAIIIPRFSYIKCFFMFFPFLAGGEAAF